MNNSTDKKEQLNYKRHHWWFVVIMLLMSLILLLFIIISGRDDSSGAQDDNRSGNDTADVVTKDDVAAVVNPEPIDLSTPNAFSEYITDGLLDHEAIAVDIEANYHHGDFTDEQAQEQYDNLLKNCIDNENLQCIYYLNIFYGFYAIQDASAIEDAHNTYVRPVLEDNGGVLP